MESLEFYVVRNKEGQYLRSKGYGGYGPSWVNELKKAKVYTKRGPACAQVTWWYSNYPDYGIPELVPIIGTLGEPIPQEKRVLTSIWKKEMEKTKRELTQAENDVNRAQKFLDEIQSGKAEKVLRALESKFNGIREKLTKMEKDGLWKE
jgi:hypothetical protein